MMESSGFTLSILSAFILAACGGGGGGGGSTPTIHAPSAPTAPSTTPAAPVDTPAKPAEPAAPTKPTTPTVPDTPPAVETSSDEKTFQNLSANALHQDGSSGSVSQLLNISLNGKNIELKVVSPHDMPARQVETLRDKAGNLVGYIGYARVNEAQKDVNGAPTVPKLHDLYLQSAAESLRQLPNSDMNYAGKMLFHYFLDKEQSDGVMREATVNAQYSSSDKTMSMLIDDNKGDKTWRLRSEQKPNASTKVAVSENGMMAGFLYNEYDKSQKPKFDGNFTGGFYGENGSVLMGSAHYDGSDAAGTGKWQGVVGATAQ